MSNGPQGSLPPGQGSGTGVAIQIKAAPALIQVGELDDSVSVAQDSTTIVTVTGVMSQMR